MVSLACRGCGESSLSRDGIADRATLRALYRPSKYLINCELTRQLPKLGRRQEIAEDYQSVLLSKQITPMYNVPTSGLEDQLEQSDASESWFVVKPLIRKDQVESLSA